MGKDFKKKIIPKTNTVCTSIASERQQPHVAISAEKPSFWAAAQRNNL